MAPAPPRSVRSIDSISNSRWLLIFFTSAFLGWVRMEIEGWLVEILEAWPRRAAADEFRDKAVFKTGLPTRPHEKISTVATVFRRQYLAA